MIKLVDILKEIIQNDTIEDIANAFVNSEIGKKYSKYDCKSVTRAFIKWASDNGIEAKIITFAPPSAEFIKQNPKFKGKSGEGDGHIMPIVNDQAIDFTVRQFGVNRPYQNPLITPLNNIKSIYSKFGYFTNKPEWFDGGKTHWVGSLSSIPSDIFNQDFGDEILENIKLESIDKIKTKILDKEDLIQFKTDILKEKIDEYNVVNKQDLNELRQSFLDYLKQQLPNTPDYVIQDWIYKMLKQSDNVNTAENIQDWIDSHLKNLKWEYKTNFPMTIDIFNDRTQQELKSRIEGEIRQDVNKDIERHKTQQRLLKSQGISKEPIILMKTKDGKYALGEGWHRTTQSFKMYPEGFTQPSVYIGIGWVDDNKDEVDEYDVENEQDLKEFIVFIKEYKQILSEGCDCLTEAEYRGRKVQLGKIMQGDIKKFKVYVKNNKGKVVKVNFGFGGKSAKGKRMVIKAKNPKRRAAYRARHNCDNPGPRWKANYWSCKKW